MKTSHNSTWLNLWNLNHKSDALSRSKLVYKSDFTMKPTVLCPNAPMQYRPLLNEHWISSFGDMTVFCSDEVYVCKDKPHSFISPGSFLPRTSPFSCIFQPILLGRCMCTASLSSTILQNPDVVEEPTTMAAGLKCLQLQMLTITEENNRVGENVPSTNTAWITGERAGKSNVTIPPNRRRVILRSR